MTPAVKQFIEDNIELIDREQWTTVMKLACDGRNSTNLIPSDLLQLIEILNKIDIDTTQIRWSLFEKALLDQIEYELFYNTQSDSQSNAWSRIDMMVLRIGYFGFNLNEITGYLLKHQDRLGLNLKPLPPKYSVSGTKGTYDLGWFNAKAFEKECL